MSSPHHTRRGCPSTRSVHPRTLGIVLGVSRGIEGATKRLMPVLFLLLVITCIRSLTLPGAMEGVTFLFKPDFAKLTGPIVLSALGLAFFKLSIGMGTMITYGSYFRDDQNIPATAVRVMLADLLVLILAGLAIFPAVFAFGFQPDAGPSLLFQTIPAVFASMPLGNIFVVIFFVLTAIAATGAMLSLMEVPVSFLSERTSLSRRNATLVAFPTGRSSTRSSSWFVTLPRSWSCWRCSAGLGFSRSVL